MKLFAKSTLRALACTAAMLFMSASGCGAADDGTVDESQEIDTALLPPLVPGPGAAAPTGEGCKPSRNCCNGTVCLAPDESCPFTCPIVTE
jgi:hypothetical protein